MAALLAGQSVCSVAKEYKIPKGTVSDWKRGGRANPTQKGEIGALLLELIQEQIKSAIVRVKLFGDESWLRKQEASQLGPLHGIDIDKAVRLLEAMSSGDDDAD